MWNTFMPVLLYWLKLLQICFLQDRRTEFYTNCLDWTDSEGEKAKVQFRVLQSSRERERVQWEFETADPAEAGSTQRAFMNRYRADQ